MDREPLKIACIGIGGAGGRILRQAMAVTPAGADLIALDTDEEALRTCGAAEVLPLGPTLNCGARPEMGRAVAGDASDAIRAIAARYGVVLLVAGMGGGIASGAAPVVARLARDQGATVIAIATLPFAFEGKRRARAADAAVDTLREAADAVIVMPCDRLFLAADTEPSIRQAFEIADLVAGDRVASLLATLAQDRTAIDALLAAHEIA